MPETTRHRLTTLLKAAGEEAVRRAAPEQRARLSNASISRNGQLAFAQGLLENALGELDDEQLRNVLEFHERRLLGREWGQEPGEDDKYRQDHEWCEVGA